MNNPTPRMITPRVRFGAELQAVRPAEADDLAFMLSILPRCHPAFIRGLRTRTEALVPQILAPSGRGARPWTAREKGGAR
jgi:hypothetical protein